MLITFQIKYSLTGRKAKDKDTSYGSGAIALL